MAHADSEIALPLLSSVTCWRKVGRTRLNPYLDWLLAEFMQVFLVASAYSQSNFQSQPKLFAHAVFYEDAEK